MHFPLSFTWRGHNSQQEQFIKKILMKALYAQHQGWPQPIWVVSMKCFANRVLARVGPITSRVHILAKDPPPLGTNQRQHINSYYLINEWTGRWAGVFKNWKNCQAHRTLRWQTSKKGGQCCKTPKSCHHLSYWEKMTPFIRRIK